MDPLKILIVEDSPEDREIYKRFLQKQNYDFDIIETDNAHDGMAYCRESVPDCIILDYHLPDTDGLDFLASFKRESKNPEVAIIMVTGQGSEETAVRAMKTGAADYITKNSISEGFFLQTILNAVERKHLRQQVKMYQDYLEQSNKALSEFSHTVSHDLKAPLRRMKAFCDLLEDECGAQLDDQGRHYIERINANAGRMQVFIDDLLNYSRVLHAHEDVGTVDLTDLVQEITDELEPLIQENNATLTIDPLPRLAVYPVKIRQLFLNLLSNAIKYHGDAPPVVSLHCRDDDTHYIFAVEDNGPGIDPSYKDDIFMPFQRLHTQEEVEGTGLGLSICRKVIDKHHGKIWFESEPDKGTTFYFRLPKAGRLWVQQNEVSPHRGTIKVA
ncbi:MAG: response regulator [Rhodospirillales bacterium]|nr:response regulator [Rhodospirillales bacterium]